MATPFVIAPLGTETASDAVAVDPAFGPLAVHCADETVTDVFVNGADGLFVDRGRGAEPVSGWRASEREVRDLAVALVGLGGRHLDD
ncbi:MAG TPA: pilus assembly protein CpaF, partial [Microbacterium sp.]|nr:pilus assembly protein CpaF [Microbacterium sp.]